MRLLTFLVALTAIGVAGCQPKPETEQKAEDASKKAHDAMESVGKAVDTATAATVLTPRLKSAITADAELNDERNHINVDSNETTVTLDGHVYTPALKARAERIVRDEMAKAGAKQNLVNNLQVKPAAPKNV